MPVDPHLSKPASRTMGNEPCSSVGPSECPAHSGPTKLERMGSEAKLVYKQTPHIQDQPIFQTRKATAKICESITMICSPVNYWRVEGSFSLLRK
jgi:hypothetical protein